MPEPKHRGQAVHTALAVAASFVGSLLLFSLEPYVGKTLLPSFGGTPLLWNSCMVFFQVALVLGYLYALLLVRLSSVPLQIGLQLVMLGSVMVLFPHPATLSTDPGTSPALSLFTTLTRHVLPSFVVLSAITTLVQSWFTGATASGESNPYRLYAASNAGSLTGLIAYPVLLEPSLSQSSQRLAFLVLVGIVLSCVAGLRVSLRRIAPAMTSRTVASDAADGVFPFASWLRVMGFSAIPASMLLGVTNYILTDVASLPLFWVIPLALYLVTFIIAFGARRFRLPAWVTRGYVLLAIFSVLALAGEANSPASLLIPLHLSVFAIGSLLCHTQVASMAPHRGYLSQYNLAIAVGGAIGGLVTLLIPPLVTDQMIEYPVALVLSTLILVATDPVSRTLRARTIDTLVPAMLLIGSWSAYRHFVPDPQSRWAALAYAPAALYVLSANTRGPRLAWRLASLFVAMSLLPSPFGSALFAERSFFGRVRVSYVPSANTHTLVHGSTVHGIQRVDEMSECHPVAYYHGTGPAGRYLSALPALPSPRRVALVGLGSGALVCYARSGDEWDLFELDPIVAKVASDPRFFTFLKNSRASKQRIMIGDARLGLQRAEAGRYDVIIVDAFSSDAIPIHLLTRQAIDAYARALAPRGALLFHVSNRFFRLSRVLGAVAPPSGFRAFSNQDLTLTLADARDLKYASEWIILTRAGDPAPQDPAWTPITDVNARVWTDDYSNPLGATRAWQ